MKQCLIRVSIVSLRCVHVINGGSAPAVKHVAKFLNVFFFREVSMRALQISFIKSCITFQLQCGETYFYIINSLSSMGCKYYYTQHVVQRYSFQK